MTQRSSTAQPHRPLADRLTEPQRRHLLECWEVVQEKGECFWRPRGSGEERTARVLARHGLMRRDHTGWAGPYVLTDDGRALAAGIASES